MNKTEILNIVNEPSKYIQIVKIDGKDSIVYSPKFVELLELIPEMLTKSEAEQEPTTKIDYRRAFKIACDLLNGDVLYGVDTDKIYELMMQKDDVVSSSSYEEYILNHLQDLDQGQYVNGSGD